MAGGFLSYPRTCLCFSTLVKDVGGRGATSSPGNIVAIEYRYPVQQCRRLISAI